jgi:outer membrane protein TolC
MKNKILLSFLFTVILLQAQDNPQNYSFSLQQAIDHALEHNYNVVNAKRDIESAQQKKRETTAAGLPQINGNVGYLQNIDLFHQHQEGF